MGEPNFANRTLFHGDNLPVLRGMNSESVDLIATDPPFNKGRDFHATPDSLAAGARFQDRWSWERDVHQDWIDQITDDYPRLMEAIESARYAHSDGMGAYMCFMAVRLLAMHRVLKPTGSIYLHCDPTASHYLKAIMDAIFGWRNFRNEIVWCYTDPAGRRNTAYYKRTHDHLLWYAKDQAQCTIGEMFMAPLAESTIRRYRPYFDERGQITYAQLMRTNPGVFAALKAVPDDLTTVWLDMARGTVAGDWWADIAPIRRKGKSQQAVEPVYWPTQKPLALYSRLIVTATGSDAIVLDPFAGCATTCVAAERLGRQWAGIDIWDEAHETVVNRLRDETGLFGTVHYATTPPTRTDDGETAAPYLRVRVRVKEPDGPRWTRAEMYAHLLEQHGPACQGCDRTFDDPRYLELDHNTPRSDGGLNHITNRILLCGPCNRAESPYQYTLSGLRRQNQRLGYMAR